MAQITYRGNLAAKSFPLLARDQGRSIIVSGPDQNFNRQTVSTEDEDKDIGIPQAYYMHNVLPFAKGFQSVGYKTAVNAPTGAGTFDSVLILRDDSGNQIYVSTDSNGHTWIFSTADHVWIDNGKLSPSITGSEVFTVAYVNGVSYLFYAGIGCWKYDFSTSSFVSVTLTGLSYADVRGLVAAQGYLIAYTVNSVAWSSTIDPTDFTPSLSTGAGGGEVQGLLGSITTVVAHTLGFIVYGTGNVVPATYSGNTRYPFNFRALVSSGGVVSQGMVDNDANTSNHYAYTTSGLQLISTQQAQTTFPQVTDFLSEDVYEEYNTSTDTFTYTAVSPSVTFNKLSIVGERYMVLSYGPTAAYATYALVYDLVLKRWGKLKINHTECFAWKVEWPPKSDYAKNIIAFMAADGTVSIITFNMDEISGTNDAVLILGKFQYVRSRYLQLQKVELDVTDSATTMQCLYTLDGKTNQPIVSGYAAVNTGVNQAWNFSHVGYNHSLVIKGRFRLNNFVLRFNVHGEW